MASIPLFSGQPLLGPDFPLPLDAPFTAAQAREAGVGRKLLYRLVAEGLVRRMLKGVYVAAQVPETLMLRARALQLVVPEGCVVVDWTATWLYTGLLLPGDHLQVPPVSLFRHAGRGRLRNDLCASGERTFIPDDLTVIEGMMVTTPLRTALDLGRLFHPVVAIGGMDGLLRTGAFELGEMLAGVERFRGYRGVVRLRMLAPMTNGRSESMGESALRFHWAGCEDLPQPEPQVPILGDDGQVRYWLDLGVEAIRFAAEYDGEAYHSSDADRAHDAARRGWISEHRDWIIKPVRRHNLFGETRNVEEILYDGVAEARRAMGRFRPER